MNLSTIKTTFIQYIALLVLSFFTPLLQARDDTALLEELRYLQAERIGIASRVPQKKQDAPGILTVITEKEILNSGARDLIDALRLVPGFDFGVDLGNVVGPMIRGNWAYEGGILILVDGLEMNERRYGTVQLGQHYPIDNIQRIEVMRGPGSIIYGGFARLGVVNIITKGFKNKTDGKYYSKERDEATITTRYGEMEKTYGHRGVSFYAAKNLTEDARISISGKASQAHRSDQIYRDVTGKSLDLANTNTLEDMFFNIGFRYQDNLTMRFILDDYTDKHQDAGVQIRDTPAFISYKTYVFDTKYHYDFNNALKLSFNFNFSQQLPWQRTILFGSSYATVSKISTTRYLGGVRLDYAFNKDIHLTSGLDFTHEEFENLATQYDHATPTVLPIYENITPYIESLIKTDWGNLTLGLRYDKHNTFESNLAPRVAFTDTLGNFHYKLLYNSSFRTPTIGNYLLNSTLDIKPERTKAYEIELGYQFNQNLSFTTNAYYLSTKDKIMLNVASQYNANSKIETAGVESELRWKQDWGYLTFNHSYTQILHNFKDFQALQQASNLNSAMTLAFPSHKFSMNANYEITPDFSINPSVILTTARYGYGYDHYDAQKNLSLRKYSPEVLGNLYFRYQNALTKGLDLGFGVYNVFNVDQNFIQPYNAGHAPLPGQSREFIFKISYRL